MTMSLNYVDGLPEDVVALMQDNEDDGAELFRVVVEFTELVGEEERKEMRQWLSHGISTELDLRINGFVNFFTKVLGDIGI